MIATVTLSPVLDWFLRTEVLRPGEIHRCPEESFRPGGKGINVSLLLAGLGEDTLALGFAAGFTGRELRRLLAEAGCPEALLSVPEGSTRINLDLTEADGRETVLGGRGPVLTEGDLARLEAQLRDLSPAGLALCGSLPPGLPVDTYARLLRAAGENTLTAADCAGEALLAALPEGPAFIKPNAAELAGLFGHAPRDRKELWDMARLLQEKGARNVAVTLGGEGALLLTEDGDRLYCPAVELRAVSTVGAGDSFLAGLLYGRLRTGDPRSALRWAAAAGGATAACVGIAGGEQVKSLLAQVENPQESS